MKTREEFIELLFDEAKSIPSRFTIDEADEIANGYFQYLYDRKRGYSLVIREWVDKLKFIPTVLLQLYLSYASLVMRFWSIIAKVVKYFALNYPTKFFCSLFVNVAEHEWKYFGVIDGVLSALNERR